MFLNNNFLRGSLKLYRYKLKAHSFLLYSLIAAQLLALLFSLGGTSHMASSNGEVSVTLNMYSASLVIAFTLFWIFFVSYQLPTSRYKKLERPLVVNSLSGSVSDIGFLLTACVFGGITSSLFGIILRIFVFVRSNPAQILHDHFFLTLGDLLIGMAAGIMYMVVISAIGYLMGMLVRISMAFILIIPAILFGLIRVYTNSMQHFLEYFTAESSLPLFILKIIAATIIVYGASILLSDRKELA
ncbi:hypothetical protein Desor_4743 [Desulfosporosinus orientis DSM 765]|uniref:Uncharacterized protein n=2 Tax=Desulfosporosinus orientis TaxID=1563 RepID=G7WG53_DESOD|nr:hypothetical protein Desor_4743 [Desulfosporosinus orientis DSM 765]